MDGWVRMKPPVVRAKRWDDAEFRCRSWSPVSGGRAREPQDQEVGQERQVWGHWMLWRCPLGSVGRAGNKCFLSGKSGQKVWAGLRSLQRLGRDGGSGPQASWAPSPLSPRWPRPYVYLSSDPSRTLVGFRAHPLPGDLLSDYVCLFPRKTFTGLGQDVSMSFGAPIGATTHDRTLD